MNYAIDISDVMFASQMSTAEGIMALSRELRISMFGSGQAAVLAEAMVTGAGEEAGAGVTRLLLA